MTYGHRVNDVIALIRGLRLVGRSLFVQEIRQAELRFKSSSLTCRRMPSRCTATPSTSTSHAGDGSHSTGQQVSSAYKGPDIADIGGRLGAVAEGVRQGGPMLLRRFNEVYFGSPAIQTKDERVEILHGDQGIGGVRDTLKASLGAARVSQDDVSGDQFDFDAYGTDMQELFRKSTPSFRAEMIAQLQPDAKEGTSDSTPTSLENQTVGRTVDDINASPIERSVDATEDVTASHAQMSSSSSSSYVVPLSSSAPSSSSSSDSTVDSRSVQERPQHRLGPKSRERRIPTTKISRLASYTSLGIGLGLGAAGELASRYNPFAKSTDTTASSLQLDSNPFLTEANAERLVETLCRVRGAALKLGQMLSIQDDALIDPRLARILERVRHAADYMPARQVRSVLTDEYGTPDWEAVRGYQSFDEKPFAAASIGQVHRAKVTSPSADEDDGIASKPDGDADGESGSVRDVALKIQYPGVARSIDSDVDSLLALIKLTNMFPPGAFLDSFAQVARSELVEECDYFLEAESSGKFKELLANDPRYYVPNVYHDLSTRRILAAEYVDGIPIEQCLGLSQGVRDYIGTLILNLCLEEVFVYNLMQSDPNWSNFFYQPPEMCTGETNEAVSQWGRLVLLDFGATRRYAKCFVDIYIRIIRAAADRDRAAILKYSRDAGFLTGYETEAMNEAHTEAVLALAEAFGTPAGDERVRTGVDGADSSLFDFGGQGISSRIVSLVPVMVKHRLTPPPIESYSIHRKLSGAFLLCTQLKSRVPCRALFERVWNQYEFGPDAEDDVVEARVS